MSRVAPKIMLDSTQKSQLQAWMQAPSTPQSLAVRARIVMRASGGEPNQQIALALGLRHNNLTMFVGCVFNQLCVMSPP